MNAERLPSEKELELLALMTRELSGCDVAKAYQRDYGRSISYGTLYVTFRRLAELGWVSVRDAETGDRRVRYFRIKGAGSAALDRGREHHARLGQVGMGFGT